MPNGQSNKKIFPIKLTASLLALLFVFAPMSFSSAETIIYPSKYYNIDSNGKVTKHIFANGIEIATADETGVKYIHADHLG